MYLSNLKFHVISCKFLIIYYGDNLFNNLSNSITMNAIYIYS